MISKEQLRQSLREKYEVYGDCWIWSQSIQGGGYGNCFVDGRVSRAHRVSYEIHKGPIDKGLLVCHTCDNRACINPDHLFLGTHADNTADMIAKNRMKVGDDLPNAKLCPDKIREVRAALDQMPKTHTIRKFAKKFGVSRWAISEIVYGRNWKHVND